MHEIRWLLNTLNYGLYCFYSFTIIDVAKKITLGEFYLSNATNFVQFLLTLVGLAFAYYKLRTYIRDSRIKSKILEQELMERQDRHLYKKWNNEFINIEENDNRPTI